MEQKLTKRQQELIRKHNAEMKIISDTAESTGLMKGTLFYAAQLGLWGIPWVVKK